MSSVVFEIPDYSIQQIKKDYYLYDLCVRDTAQLENIAITIQSLYLYHSILVAGNYPKTIESSLCRTIIIMSYSILEAIVISVGYKIQKQCLNCRHRCPYFSDSMFTDDKTRDNEKKAFGRADEFLKRTGINCLTSRARQYYENFRDNRNNVHLAKNAKVISQDPIFTRTECNTAIQFFQSIIKLIRENYLEFYRTHRCGDIF